MARGILKNSIARKAAYIPDASSVACIKELNQRILDVINDETWEIKSLETTLLKA
ncbi:hypothetical protein [Dyadobacter sp. MSC1_007]|jgi:peptidase E|uniref:hypothetical protein n=1 Tax=Dyadobacter sp. MSC1_007 TaxID=2909264 RepID=UPI00202FF3C2|nr:hypothetical protein [Dyadobacter sp. MSC1_007]